MADAFDSPPGDLLLVSVGNTRTRVGLSRSGVLEPSRVLDNTSIPTALGDFLGTLRADGGPPVLIASVNPEAAGLVVAAARAAGLDRIERFGPDLPIPIQDALEDRTTVGQDRLLGALGAWWRTRQACVVIDAGTAITVDFVDGAGVFQGGAIAPGLGMMLRAMHAQTAALPEVDLKTALPAPDVVFGQTTAKAMCIGVLGAARGLAHLLIDRYAEHFEAYPNVIATGGDAPLLFEDDPLVERIVPDLPLVGMLAAVERLSQPPEADDDG